MYFISNSTLSEGDRPFSIFNTLINSDPFGKGWLVKMELSNPDETHDLLSAEVYGNLIS